MQQHISYWPKVWLSASFLKLSCIVFSFGWLLLLVKIHFLNIFLSFWISFTSCTYPDIYAIPLPSRLLSPRQHMILNKQYSLPKVPSHRQSQSNQPLPPLLGESRRERTRQKNCWVQNKLPQSSNFLPTRSQLNSTEEESSSRLHRTGKLRGDSSSAAAPWPLTSNRAKPPEQLGLLMQWQSLVNARKQ